MKNQSFGGGLTIPTETGFVEETLELLKRWGADAVRDCDGTAMPDEIKRAGYKVYSTYFVARGDNGFAKTVPDERTHFFVCSEYVPATGDTLSLEIMRGYFGQQIQPEYDCDLRKYWEVIDRTTGEVVPADDWSADRAANVVTIRNCKKFHQYSVSFLARAIWDSTQMYNYITNNWTREKDLPFDARCKKTGEYIVERLDRWLDEHPDTDVVRFTTFFYHFALLFNDKGKEKFVDWFGYSGSVSVEALEAFEKEYGYALRPEDFVDEGCYNSPFRVPSKAFSDYMDFTMRFVSATARKLVEKVHEKGREAMMFLGDNWIGTEPYGKYFKDIGLDAVVGSVGGGVTVRMLTDIPDLKYVEGRFLPYFFPDTFYEGGEPTKELKRNWRTARRAMLKKPLDRIGYGGYLSLAAKFPDFVEEVERIAKEFKEIYRKVKGNNPRSNLKVAVINAWGKLRSWQCFMVAHELWYQKVYSYQGILEALSGMPVDVEFLSFDDVLAGGLEGFDVAINAGDAGTAFSGGRRWDDPALEAAVREWVYNGGGLIGVGEPTAYPKNGRYFALADVFGVDKEQGFTLSTDKYNLKKAERHFILEDVEGALDYGEGMKGIYAKPDATVLDIDGQDVFMAVNDYGKGRAVYIAGLPYSVQNERILYRACHYAAHKEALLKRRYCDDTAVTVQYYPQIGEYAVVNNGEREVDSTFYDGEGRAEKLKLAAGELLWRKA